MMAGIAFAVENRQFDPTVVRVESDAPDDRRDPFGNVVEFQNFRLWLPERLVTRLDRGANAVAIDKFVDRVLDTFRDGVGLVEVLFQVGGKMEDRTANFLEPAVQPHALRRRTCAGRYRVRRRGR